MKFLFSYGNHRDFPSTRPWRTWSPVCGTANKMSVGTFYFKIITKKIKVILSKNCGVQIIVAYGPGVDAICGLSLFWLVLSFALRRFSPGSPISSLLLKSQHFQIPN